MNRLFLSIVLFTICNYTVAQDKVVLKTGDTLNVYVTKSTETTIEYTYPNESLVNEKQKRDISCIIYASGRREDIKSTDVVIPTISNKNEWEKVIITTNRDDVKGLTMVKSIGVVAGGGMFNTASGAHEAAITKIKKKAANLKCGIVLITAEDYGGQFRNALNLSGEAYK